MTHPSAAEDQKITTRAGMPPPIEFATQAISLNPAGSRFDQAPLNDRPPGTLSRAESLTFTIRIWDDEIELAGAVPTQAAGATLLKRLRRLQPSADIWDNRLAVDPEAPELPPMSELDGLLTEMIASTRNSKLHFTFDSVTVTGVSDTPVIRAAIQVRMDEMAGKLGVETQNHIRIIPAEDFLKPSERLRRANEGIRHFSRIAEPPAVNGVPTSEAGSHSSRTPGELLLASEIDDLSSPAQAVIQRLQGAPDSPAVLKPIYEEIRSGLGAEPILHVQFGSNSATLKPETIARIRGVIAQADPYSEFLILGYASMEGAPKTNARLSLQRAEVVGKVIAESDQVAATEAFYFGPTRRFDLRESTANRVVEVWRLRSRSAPVTATAQR